LSFVDEKSSEEALALAISLSLRSMDISIEQIVEFYHEQIADLMANGSVDGRHFGSIQDQTLFAHVHSFFVHFGSARDYLAALIATRINKEETKIVSKKKIDSLGTLVPNLESKHFGQDALLDLLEAEGLLQPAEDPKKRRTAGWLKASINLRDQFVHRRPYGGQHVERYGYAEAIAPNLGVFRYVRPILIEGDLARDVLDVVVDTYKNVNKLFYEMAEASGWCTEIYELTNENTEAVYMIKE
jgi:hypothetical protein